MSLSFCIRKMEIKIGPISQAVARRKCAPVCKPWHNVSILKIMSNSNVPYHPTPQIQHCHICVLKGIPTCLTSFFQPIFIKGWLIILYLEVIVRGRFDMTQRPPMGFTDCSLIEVKKIKFSLQLVIHCGNQPPRYPQLSTPHRYHELL